MTIACLAMFSILGCGKSLAHMDRIVTIREDGTLVGIPLEYGPPALHVAFAASSPDPRISAVALDLGKSHTRLPECITGLLTTRSLNDIKASASWYHDESIVPYYLNLEFFDPGYNKSDRANPGYALLFNLRSGKLLQIEAYVRGAEKSLQLVRVDLSARCTPAELKEIVSSDFERFQRRAGGTITQIAP